MLKSKRNLVLTGAVATALCLTGCGNRTPANPPVDDTGSTAASSTGTTGPAAPAAATPATTLPMTAPAPAPAAAYAAPQVGSLVVANVEKTSSGIILFKTLTVKGSVINSSNVALSGTLKVQFKKKGLFSSDAKDTGNKTVDVPLLQPGQSFPFSVAADEHNDTDADVTVDSNPPANAAPAAAPGVAPAGTTAMMTTPGYGYPAAPTGYPTTSGQPY